MPKVLICLFILISLPFVTNAQRNFPVRIIVRPQTNRVSGPWARIRPRPIQRKKAREEQRRLEIIQRDSLNLNREG